MPGPPRDYNQSFDHDLYTEREISKSIIHIIIIPICFFSIKHRLRLARNKIEYINSRFL